MISTHGIAIFGYLKPESADNCYTEFVQLYAKNGVPAYFFSFLFFGPFHRDSLRWQGQTKL